MSYTTEMYVLPVSQVVDMPTEKAAALIPREGRYLTSLGHASAGGELFRDGFGQYVRARYGSDLLHLLLHRDATGPATTPWDYPSVGWLTRDEIHQVLLTDTGLGTSDEDLNQWAQDLHRALRMADLLGVDIVTVYT